MEIRGDDKFRLRWYRDAADVIETWPEPLEEVPFYEKGLSRACVDN